MENKMFCYQCQETAGCVGCKQSGVCGKTPDVAAMQDLLVFVTKTLSAVTTRLRSEGKQISREINHKVTMNLFITITNANFDKEMIVSKIEETLKLKDELISQVSFRASLPEAANWTGDKTQFEEKAKEVGVLATEDEDVRSLRELILYGLKGLAAYATDAVAQDEEDD